MIYTIEGDGMTYTLSSYGGELISAKSDSGTEYMWGGDPLIWGEHSPMLFPICGRLLNKKYTYRGKEYEMDCHGFLSHSECEASNISENTITFRLASSDATKKSYPFDFELSVTYTAEKNTLSVKTLIKNTGADVMPFMFGGHPGFNVPMEDGLSFDDYKLDFNGAEPLLYREQNGPFVSPDPESFPLKNGIYPLNSDEICSYGTIILSGAGARVQLLSDNGKRSITISMDDAFKYFCIWKSPAKDASYVCLEPWTDVPSDGITPENFETRKNMLRLAPGDSSEFTYRIQYN